MVHKVADYARRIWFFFFDRVILYPLLSWIIPQFGILFMNLGYWPNEKEDKKMIKVVEKYSTQEDPNRPHYYLYEKALSLHPEYPKLEGLTLLDVGCGQGNGMNWIERAHPDIYQVRGVDRVVRDTKQIRQGNAEQLPIASASFDIIINVESSHLYNNCEKFFEECYRVLLPGGFLCWIDLRYSRQEQTLRNHATTARLLEYEFIDVTGNVLLGIEKTAGRYDQILQKAPWFAKFFTSSLRATYCAPGTHTYNRFVTGEKKYFVAIWQKPYEK